MSLHILKKSKLTIALKEVSKTDRFGKVTLGESNLISKFSEKKGDGVGLINGGIYLLNKSLFKDMNFDKSFSFESEILEKINKNNRFRGLAFKNLFFDIGTPNDLEKSQSLIRSLQLN